MSDDAADKLFWGLIEEVLERPDAEIGTIMGSECLRVRGEFTAMIANNWQGMVVKLPAERVATLIDDGVGRPFAPAGKTFREWVEITDVDEDRWRTLLDEAYRFASG